ncbi:MAG: hypothetical protein ACTJE3_06550 [Lactococcus cremoris]
MKCKNCNKEIEYVNCHYFTQQLHPVSLGAYESDEFPFNSPGVDLYNETVDMVFMGEEQLDETKRI